METNGTHKNVEKVSLIIDGRRITVAKGTNIIEAARQAGIDVPHYCYHPALSVPANCRICQVKVTGQPKLAVACHAQVAEGMEVFTHHTSEEVRAAQAGTMEFILINHPLDCTVCDQAGHCKLQDYHYEYNAKPSRFLEQKEHKVKAEPLGPHVILDGERCIMCTRCVRFCDEITKTGELGLLNRGDRSVIAINPGKELNNPLSGTVVDLCPVGALTHRDWRFNTRIWFTQQTDSICPGCSTGCNVKVAERDGRVVQVKARPNYQVNKEWLCDEGRYGFDRFLSADRILSPWVNGKEASWDAALAESMRLGSGPIAIFAGGDLLLEEYGILRQFMDKFGKGGAAAISYKERPLSDLQKILVSPDYCPNFRGAEWSGVVSGDLNGGYKALLDKVRAGEFKSVLILGDRGILPEDCDAALMSALKAAACAASLTDALHPVFSAAKIVFPGRSLLEKSGLLINRAHRLQYANGVVPFPRESEPEWRTLNRVAQKLGGSLTNALSDRELTLGLIGSDRRLSGLKISVIKEGGVCLKSWQPSGSQGEAAAHV